MVKPCTFFACSINSSNDKDDLLSIKGIGKKTLENYGDYILTIIN